MDIFKWYYQRRMLNAMVQHSWQEAERYTRKLMARSGESMGLQYNLALIALGAGRVEEAYDLGERAVKRYGESLRLCRLLGDISYPEGHADRARRWYSLALSDGPDRKESLLMTRRLEILGDSARYDEVVQLLALLPKANALMEEDPEEAKRLYLQVVERDSTQVEALNNLGVLSLEEGNDAEQAIGWFTKVLALVDHQGAVRNLAKAKKALQKG